MSWVGRWGRGLREEVSDPFERLTGICVRQEKNIGLKLPDRLTRALDDGERPPFDVVWSNSVPAMRLARQGRCSLLRRDLVPNLANLGPRARPEGFSDWPMVIAYVVYLILGYRREVFPDGPPTSWEVLLEPRFRGKVALYPHGYGFFPIAQVLGGGRVEDIPGHMEPCWQLLRRLKPQIGNLDYSIGMEVPIGRGEIDLCFRALPNAIEFRDQGLEVAWAAPREGVTDTTDVLWIPTGVPEAVEYWAQRYIDFALSREVQERWCEKMGVMPVHPGARPGRELLDTPSLPRSADDLAGVLYLPETLKLELEEVWEEKFRRC